MTTWCARSCPGTQASILPLSSDTSTLSWACGLLRTRTSPSLPQPHSAVSVSADGGIFLGSAECETESKKWTLERNHFMNQAGGVFVRTADLAKSLLVMGLSNANGQVTFYDVPSFDQITVVRTV